MNEQQHTYEVWGARQTGHASRA